MTDQNVWISVFPIDPIVNNFYYYQALYYSVMAQGSIIKNIHIADPYSI